MLGREKEEVETGIKPKNVIGTLKMCLCMGFRTNSSGSGCYSPTLWTAKGSETFIT
jgi:hypothetical protein